MIQGMLWIVGSYGVCTLFIHLLYRSFQRRNGGTAHYVLITKNNQMQIEWYIRSLQFYSSLRGKCIKITVLDNNSTDETLPIVQRLSFYRDIDLLPFYCSRDIEHIVDSLLDEEVIVIQLSNQEDLHKIPLLQ